MDCGDSGGDKRDVRRPMNAFLIFCKRHRSIVREKNPDLDNRSVTRILGDLWANLKDEEKSMYTDLAKQYKDAFMKANPDYKWHNPEKAVLPQKPNMPKPTNMKVLKNDLDLFSEGSIMPGKLADPSNMGGLSLLLIAGQQSENKNIPTAGTQPDKNIPTAGTQPDKPSETLAAITTTSEDSTNPPSSHRYIHVPPDNVPDIGDVNGDGSLLSRNVTNTHPVDCDGGVKPENNTVSSNEKTTSLFDLAEMCSSQLDTPSHPETFKDTHSLLREAILDIKPDTSNNTHTSNTPVISYPNSNGELTNQKTSSALSMRDTNEASDVENEESAMITCGKLVVNHIIDKLYSSEIATAARNVSKPTQEPPENVSSIITEDISKGHAGGNTMTGQPGSVSVIQTDNKSMEYDEPDGWRDQATSAGALTADKQGDGDQTVGDTKQGIDQSDNTAERGRSDSTGSTVYTEITTSKRKHLLSETGSTEGEELEESHPVRKSRRRNRGQRYQELINEGIIQPSKERMAALQQPNTKDEMIEEDFQSIDSYILPETAIRRIRKRTTSESAKDKMFQAEDAKRYKTGDFDLEAHIATLPACPIENMGRKRGLFRSRHCSESSHIRKSPADDLHIVPVFSTEKTVSLPPHVRLPSPQRVTEPVTGSRKRKARKHSITHLIPVPPTLRTDSKPSQNVPNAVESEHPVLDTQRSDNSKTGDTIATDGGKGENSLGNIHNKTSKIDDMDHDKSKDINTNNSEKMDSSKFENMGASKLEIHREKLENNGIRLETKGEKLETNGEKLETNGEKLETNGVSVSDSQGKTDHTLYHRELCDSTVSVLKEENGCDTGRTETVGNGDMANGARGTGEKLKEEKDFCDDNNIYVSSKTEGQGHNGCAGSLGKVGAENKQESAENCQEVGSETVKLTSELGLGDKVTSGKFVERSYKSLQEVDSNIPRTGSDVILQNEAGDGVARKPILQDSLDKKASNTEKPETDMNFNSTVHA